MTAIREPRARPAIPADFGWCRDFLTYPMDQGWVGWLAMLIAVGARWPSASVGSVGHSWTTPLDNAAVFGIVLNLNFLLAGPASRSPVLLLPLPLVVGYKVPGLCSGRGCGNHPSR
jgi:hypothetical protein